MGQTRFEKCVLCVYFPLSDAEHVVDIAGCIEPLFELCVVNLVVTFLILFVVVFGVSKKFGRISFIHCLLNFHDACHVFSILSILKCGHVKHTTCQEKMEGKDVLPCTRRTLASLSFIIQISLCFVS